MRIVVHIAHESVKKTGGGGPVFSGVCNLQAYKSFMVRRSSTSRFLIYPLILSSSWKVGTAFVLQS